MARTFLRAYLAGMSGLVKAKNDMERLKSLPQKLEDGELIDFNGKSMVGVIEQLSDLELEVIDASRVNDASRCTEALKREYFEGFEKLVKVIGEAEGDTTTTEEETEDKEQAESETPLTLEDQLLDAVAAGDKKEVRAICKELKNKWFALDPEEVEDALDDIKDCVADKDVEAVKEILAEVGEEDEKQVEDKQEEKTSKTKVEEEVSEDDDELLADFNDCIKEEDYEDAQLCLDEMKEKDHPKYKECKKILDNTAGEDDETTEDSDEEGDVVDEILDDLDKALENKDVKECEGLLEELLEETGEDDEDYVDYKAKVDALSKPESKRKSRRNRRK
jgi:hypothetical protein